MKGLGGLMRMRWRRVVLAHWPIVDVELVERRLPYGVTLDAFWGRPWRSVVAFEAVGPVPLPLLAWPLRRAFGYLQLNLRTYVRGPLGPGIVLLDTVVDHRLATLAPRLAGMPYELDGSLSVRVKAGHVEVHSARELLTGEVDREPATKARLDTLEDFLLERYVVYGQTPRGEPYAVRLAHQPWEVQRATLRSPIRGEAELAHFAASVSGVRIVEARRLQSSPADGAACAA